MKGSCSCEPIDHTDEDKYARRNANLGKASGYDGLGENCLR